MKPYIRTKEDKSQRFSAIKTLKAIYLVVISTKGGDEEGKKLVMGKVLQAARAFERTVVEMKGSDEKRMWVGVEVLSRKKVMAAALRVDRWSI